MAAALTVLAATGAVHHGRRLLPAGAAVKAVKAAVAGRWLQDLRHRSWEEVVGEKNGCLSRVGVGGGGQWSVQAATVRPTPAAVRRSHSLRLRVAR